MKDNYVVIMAGGIGSRFWPFSRTNHPKQFHDILGIGKTLIQQTAERFSDICPQENIYVVTNQDYYGLVKEQLPYLKDEQILLEPVMRNTAPCVAYAAYKIIKQNPNACLLVAPADHIITDEATFVEVSKKAIEEAKRRNILVTIGIKPSRPDTGYGYIQYLENEKIGELLKVKTFTEKPNMELAVTFLESGDFVWNAGIFIWSAKSILESFESYLPDIAAIFKDVQHTMYTEAEANAVKRAYFQCRNISIDYGIMEHAKNVYVLPADFGWSDLGTWKSLFEVLPKDEQQNVLHGNIMVYETQNCIVKMPSDKLVVVHGLDNFIVAERDGVLVICHKDQEQRIKQFVSDAKEAHGEKYA